MILTHKLLNEGKSSNGGWNKLQLNALGVEDFTKGWKHSIIGKDYPEEKIHKFLSLKDYHFKKKIEGNQQIKKKVKTKMNILDFYPVAEQIPYQKQYLHPNWQKMRLHVLTRDNFTCVNCGSKDKTLHAHHLKYKQNDYIWNVPHWYIATLCEDCHSQEHNKDLRVK